MQEKAGSSTKTNWIVWATYTAKSWLHQLDALSSTHEINNKRGLVRWRHKIDDLLLLLHLNESLYFTSFGLHWIKRLFFLSYLFLLLRVNCSLSFSFFPNGSRKKLHVGSVCLNTTKFTDQYICPVIFIYKNTTLCRKNSDKWRKISSTLPMIRPLNYSRLLHKTMLGWRHFLWFVIQGYGCWKQFRFYRKLSEAAAVVFSTWMGKGITQLAANSCTSSKSPFYIYWKGWRQQRVTIRARVRWSTPYSCPLAFYRIMITKKKRNFLWVTSISVLLVAAVPRMFPVRLWGFGRKRESFKRTVSFDQLSLVWLHRIV